MPRHPDTKERILRATWTVLTRSSVPPTLPEIAAAAEVSRQTIHLHFGDRTTLLEETLRFVDEQLDLAEAVRPMESATDGARLLEAFAGFLASYIPRIIDLAMAVERQADSDEAAAALLARRVEFRRRGAASMARRLAEEQSLRPDLDEDAAISIILGLGSRHLWVAMVREAGLDEKAYGARVAHMLKTALLRNP